MTAFPRRVTMIIATMAALAGAARAQDSIRPGYWESIDQVVSPLASRKTDRRCITPKDVAKFMSCYINHHYECVCPEETIGAGKIAFKGQCVDHKGQHVDIEGTGVFTATTLHMTARVNFKILGLPMDADAATDAHRLGDTCPPGSTGGPPAGGQPQTFR
jgi:hypothetical protein